MHFGDRLIKKIRQIGNPLCVGLDPYLDKIPPVFRDGSMAANDPRTAPAVERFLKTVIDLVDGKVAIIKPQSAFFEKMGWKGIKVLSNIIAYARSKDILVLMDAKRGDIGSTATAYAETYLTKNAELQSDALTVNPFLGRDTLKPYLAALETNSAGIFILVKTSNPGSVDYQHLIVEDIPLYHYIGLTIKPIADSMIGKETGWSSVGIVVGATYPEEANNLRAVLPNTLFLIPGYGAQGGDARNAVRTFIKGPNGPEGGIINSSRGILFPETGNTDHHRSWELAINEATEQAVDSLKEALVQI